MNRPMIVSISPSLEFISVVVECFAVRLVRWEVLTISFVEEMQECKK